MGEAIVGAVVLVAIGIVCEIIAQNLRRNAMADPDMAQRAREIAEAQAESAKLGKEVATIQAKLQEAVDEIERWKNQIRANEARLARVTRGMRIVVEMGAPGPKSKRFDGSVYNKNASSLYAGGAVPSFYAKEVQVVLWAESLGEARALFEKTYTPKDGYSSVFHGEIFPGRA